MTNKVDTIMNYDANLTNLFHIAILFTYTTLLTTVPRTISNS